jgi:D-glycero-D-manno-heptose 1,7-bisphosphate phosphatase
MNFPSALILDRDGTLNAMVCNPKGEQDSPYFASQLELYPQLGKLLHPFVKAQVPLFIVTNQPGITKGNFKLNDLQVMHETFRQSLLKEGVSFVEIISCIHHPVGTPEGDQSLIINCECRKPKPGMLLQIQEKYKIDLSNAIYIGDSQVDEDAAKAAGVGTFRLVRTFVSSSVPKERQSISFPDAPELKIVLSRFESIFEKTRS